MRILHGKIDIKRRPEDQTQFVYAYLSTFYPYISMILTHFEPYVFDIRRN